MVGCEKAEDEVTALGRSSTQQFSARTCHHVISITYSRTPSPRSTQCDLSSQLQDTLRDTNLPRRRVLCEPRYLALELDPGLTHVNAVRELLTPFDAKLMKRFALSTRINFVKNDAPDCVAPLREEASLFAN